MKILLFSHPAFFLERQLEMDWISRYAKALSSVGHEAEYFDPFNHRVAQFHSVHVFSREEPETWISLRALGAKVFVIPSIFGEFDPPKHENGIGARFLTLAGTVIRAGIQRRWPPKDERSFYAQANHYVAISEKWKEYLTQTWKVDSGRIISSPEDPVGFANSILAI